MSGVPHAGDLVTRGVRPEDDVPRLAALDAAVEAVDRAGEEVSEEAIRETLAWPGHDPWRDRCVIEEPGQPDRLIAHGLVWKGSVDPVADLAVAVHPAWRGRGLGRALLVRALERARTLGATAARAYADEAHPAGAPFLRRHGFTPVAAYTQMRFPARLVPPPATLPAGYTVRDYDDLRDPALLARAMTDAYSGLWGHHPVSVEELTQWLPGWREDGILLLFDQRGGIAGMCRAEVRATSSTAGAGAAEADGMPSAVEASAAVTEEAGAAGSVEARVPDGQIDAPGIVPERRAEDLHVPLLLAAMRWLRAQGAGAIVLESWGDDQGTLDRYGALGFTVTRRAISFRLEL